MKVNNDKQSEETEDDKVEESNDDDKKEKKDEDDKKVEKWTRSKMTRKLNKKWKMTTRTAIVETDFVDQIGKFYIECLS